ncbi:MAG: PspC domain-containing protein [Candidatus Falkowbacteria bacterium]|nr:PspC domain-containing protein [Candidatus Falkowbacteria bacterium]
MKNKIEKLHRSSNNRVFAGICGGLGEYFGIDPVIFRILFVALTLMNGGFLLLYFILIFVIPLKGQEKSSLENKLNCKGRKGIIKTLIIIFLFLILCSSFFHFNIRNVKGYQSRYSNEDWNNFFQEMRGCGLNEINK